MTKATIKKIAHENGIDLTGILFRKVDGAWEIEMEVTADIDRMNREHAEKTGQRVNAPGVVKLIKAYNRATRKLVKFLPVSFYGRSTTGGPVTWYEGTISTSERLAMANID